MKTLPFVPQTAVPAVIVPVEVSDAREAREAGAALAAAVAGADAVEWRADGLSSLSEAAAACRAMAESFSRAELPLLATVRTAFEGGRAHVTEAEYAHTVAALVEGKPVAVDIEICRAESARLIGHAHDCGVQVVASHHDFDRTPDLTELRDRFASMAQSGADAAKIAVMPHSRDDVATMVTALAEAQALGIPVVGIAMGRRGALTRLAAGELGSAATFAAGPQGTSAPGQYSISQVREALRLFG